MASILLLTADAAHAAATRSKAALEAGGANTVTVSTAKTATGLDAAWGAGFDLIATVRCDRGAPFRGWVADKWASGVPVFAGGPEEGGSATTTDHLAKDGMGILTLITTRTDSPSYASDVMTDVAPHDVTAGFTGDVTVLGGPNYTVRERGAPAGSVVGSIGGNSPGVYMVAVEAGDPLPTTGSAPARAVFCGWLYAGQTNYTADGLTIIAQAVDWLTPAGTPTGAATLTATTTWAVDGTQHHATTATLAVTSTWAIDGSATTPRTAGADLAVTATWAIDGSVDTPGKDAAATLAVTATWAIDGAAVGDREAAAHLSIGGSWSIDGATTGDLPTVALDNLSFTVHRPPPYHRVKVTGKRGSNSYSYDPNPRLIACAAPNEVRLTVGDPAAELWLEPEAGTWWYGDLHRPTNPRLAANTTAFARTEGSWAGGRVETDEGDLIRWATADDFTITTELVGPASVKVTLAPGAGLAAGEWFVNRPPRDTGLPAEVESRPLPVFTAWGVSRSTIDVTGHSAPIGPSTKPDYVHDAGFACGFDTGPRTPDALAQDIATRAQQPGELILECPPDDVQVGERWRVRVDATAGLDADVVVLGRPDLTWGPGQQSMSLRVWAMTITPT